MSDNGDEHALNEEKMPQDHHMKIPWNRISDDEEVPAMEATVKLKSSLVGRVGIQMLSCGTGAWRVREAMNTVARTLGLICSADIGLTSIHYTCFNYEHSYTQVLALASTGVNTDKLNILEHFVKQFPDKYAKMTIRQIHQKLDAIQVRRGNYPPFIAGCAAAVACAGFTFLLGGGPIEMLCAFFGAGIGNWLRQVMIRHRLTLLASISVSVMVACLVYFFVFLGLRIFFHIPEAHEAGYIGAMLFVIPGFPFITSMLDIFKSDMRSGLERLTSALLITIVATLVGWLVAMLVHFRPENFLPLGLGVVPMLLLRLPASFCGVYGFSMMFNSPQKMAVTAGIIGAFANTLRLELAQLTNLPPAAAAFCGALLAGLLASLINRYNGYPRISLTVPSIVIMVPGLYIYRAVYNIGLNSIGVGALWLTKAILIIMFLPLGLFVARVLMDKDWRHNG